MFRHLLVNLDTSVFNCWLHFLVLWTILLVHPQIVMKSLVEFLINFGIELHQLCKILKRDKIFIFIEVKALKNILCIFLQYFNGKKTLIDIIFKLLLFGFSFFTFFLIFFRRRITSLAFPDIFHFGVPLAILVSLQSLEEGVTGQIRVELLNRDVGIKSFVPFLLVLGIRHCYSL